MTSRRLHYLAAPALHENYPVFDENRREKIHAGPYPVLGHTLDQEPNSEETADGFWPGGPEYEFFY